MGAPEQARARPRRRAARAGGARAARSGSGMRPSVVPSHHALVDRAVERRRGRRRRAARRRPRRGSRRRPRATRRRARPTTPTTGVGWIGPAVVLVVERDVARDDRQAERLAGQRHALDGLGELVADVSPRLGVAEVEAVGDGGRPGAGAGDVPGRLADGAHPAAGAGRARCAGRCRRARPRSPARDGVSRTTAASPPGRTTVPEPTRWSYWRNTQRLARRRRRAEQRAQRSIRGRPPCVAGERARRRGGPGACARHLVARAAVDEGARPGCRRPSRRRGSSAACRRPSTSPMAVRVDLPAAADVLDLGQRARARRPPAIRSCDSEIMISNGSMSCLAQRDTRRGRCRCRPRRCAAISDGRGGQPGGAEVLQRLEQAALEQLERALDQLLARERVADLHARALLGRALAEALRGEHAGAADAVAAGARRRRGRRRLPGPAARADVSRSAGSSPTHMAFTRQLCS